jgi:YVTN family beta-propeller protein
MTAQWRRGLALRALLLVCCAASGTAYAAPFAYITNADAGTVSVIDTATNSVVETISPLGHPVGVAVSADGTRVYVTSILSATVDVIDAFTNSVITHIPTGTFPNDDPESAVLHPTQPRLYVTAGHDQVTIIDTTTNTVTGSIPVTTSIGFDVMQAIAINPAGTRLYTTQVFSAMMNVIDTSTNGEIATIPGAGSRGIAVHPSGSPVYVCGDAGGGGNTVNLIDAGTNMISGSIGLGPDCFSPFGLALNAAGTILYVACGNSGRVAVVDTVGNTLITTFPVGFVPLGLQLTPDESRLYVANAGDNTVSAVDTSTNTVITAIPVDDEPHAFGRFIGPNFTCNNGVLEPGEGCDDGDPMGGPCPADCLVPHDSVILPVKPITAKIGAGKTSVTKKVKVKVRNADIVPAPEMPGHTIELNATADCPSLTVTTPDFGTGSNRIQLAGGEKATAVVEVTAFPSVFTSFNLKAPTRCTLTFTARSLPSFGTSEPTPSNNVATAEFNILDKNDPEQTAVHESVLSSIKPITVKVKDAVASVSKTAKPKVGNADYLPTAEAAAAHVVSVSAVDGDCPASTVGAVTFHGAPSTGVDGGKTATGALPLSITAAGFSSPSALSPARCTAVLTVVGPPGDTDASNNQTRLTIDVIDANDF